MLLTPTSAPLQREVRLTGAILLGLGSIVGTGVFVSLGIAAGVTGPAVLLAVAVAVVVALFNGLSSAQLAANHPVSGGTYEYGYRWLNPAAGRTAGWLFLAAKSASAATAALGFSGYLFQLFGWAPGAAQTATAVASVLLVGLLVGTGMQRSNFANTVIVFQTLGALSIFVLAGLPLMLQPSGVSGEDWFVPETQRSVWSGFLEACALMFVAFTGYGRIATLGEEVVDPRRTIPRAIWLTLLISAVLYLAVGGVAIATVGATFLKEASLSQTASLAMVAREWNRPGVALVVTCGAMTAMLGVLLNLMLGLSRVVLAMGRRGDLPALMGQLDPAGKTPRNAVAAVCLLIVLLTALGNVKLTWSFSAFTVLVYYALTNLAATKLSPTERLYPPFVPWLGLVSCLALAIWVDPAILAAGVGLIGTVLMIYWLKGRNKLQPKSQ